MCVIFPQDLFRFMEGTIMKKRWQGIYWVEFVRGQREGKPRQIINFMMLTFARIQSLPSSRQFQREQ